MLGNPKASDYFAISRLGNDQTPTISLDKKYRKVVPCDRTFVATPLTKYTVTSY